LPLLLRRRSSGALPGFVLILFRVEFEIEHAGEIAAGPSAATTTALLRSERHLNVAERSFGAQQMLQGALLRTKRVFPALALELVGGRSISSAAASRSFTKFWNS